MSRTRTPGAPWRGLLRWGLTLGLLAWVLTRVELSTVLGELRLAPLWIWAVVPLLFVLNSLLYCLRVLALTAQPVPPLGASLRAVLLGNFWGLALPMGGGEAVKVYTLGRHCQGGSSEAAAAITCARLIELLVWAGLVVWAAIAVLPVLLPSWLPLAWGSALGFVFLGSLGLVILPRLDTLPPWLPSGLRSWLTQWLQRQAALSLGARARSLLWCLPFAALNCTTAWLVIQSYGLELRWTDALGLIPTGDVLIALPVSVGGIGVREATFVHLLEGRGGSAELGVAVALTRWWGDLSRGALGGLLLALGTEDAES